MCISDSLIIEKIIYKINADFKSNSVIHKIHVLKLSNSTHHKGSHGEETASERQNVGLKYSGMW